MGKALTQQNSHDDASLHGLRFLHKFGFFKEFDWSKFPDLKQEKYNHDYKKIDDEIL